MSKVDASIACTPSFKQAPAYICNDKPISAAAFYAIACDPAQSVAIEACAGAGKTWMLVSRILRALLAGAKPESILAITYTKKAAGEMRERLNEWLRDFAHELDDAKLTAELVHRGINEKKALTLLPKLRALHTQLLSQPRSVEIRTFHSWFAQLLGAAPLGVLHDLGLPVQYDLVEDDSELFKPAWYELLQMCTQDQALKDDLDEMIRTQGNFNTQEALRAAWSWRMEFMLADEHGVPENSIEDAPDPSQEIMQESFKLRWLGFAKALGQEKTKTPQKAANDLEFALTSIVNPQDRLEALRQALFVKTEHRLSKNLLKFEAAQQAEIELIALLKQDAQHQAYVYQQRMLRLTRALLKAYAQVKRDQKLIDMADLERVALRLLGDTETYGWVAERLDARVSQVLIDEFQDTNPLQWQALKGWLSGYAGAGGGGRVSVFIVGDPKQSIYRFRRADPAVFIAACDFIKQVLGGSKLSCDHTRRNAPQVMSVVNVVFENAQNKGEFKDFRAHTTAAQTQGNVARLPMIMRPSKAKESLQQELASVQWRDSLREPKYQEEEKLRLQEIRQVAVLIEQWIKQKKWKPSDIKVLSRRKDRLRELLVELNHRQIAWRFTDDVHLIETMEVQDMVALLDVLASPAKDLSLAQVLRSPIFGLDDEALILICERVRQHKAQLEGAPLTQQALLQAKEGKSESENESEGEGGCIHAHANSHAQAKTMASLVCWWDVLMDSAQQTPHFEWPHALKDVAVQLERWKRLAQTLPPHDLLDAIYDQANILERYAKAVPAAMRSSVQANLRALLQQALTLDSGRYATPYNFVRTLRKKMIKSEHPEGGGAVDLVTVHGAKGLEAPVIIVLDTDPTATRAQRLSVLMSWPAENDAPSQFAFYVSKKNLPAHLQTLATQEEQADQREELNALYVAMTRAKEQLVFSALQTGTTINERSWWHRLDDLAEVTALESLLPVVNEKEQDSSQNDKAKIDITSLINTGPHANEQSMQAFEQKVLPPYQAPKLKNASLDDVYDLIRAETGLQGVARETLATQDAQTQAQRFGMALHRLLELESLDESVLTSVAKETGLTAEQMQEAATRAKAIFEHSQSGVFFDTEQIKAVHKEVELSYEARVLRIDRLVQLNDGQWWILDFKSAALPLNTFGDEYKAQLTLYKQALATIMPKAKIHAALIAGGWGGTGVIGVK